MTLRPRILVRATASGLIGAGHVARSLAVARELSAVGADVHWICDRSTAAFLVGGSVQPSTLHVLDSAATEGCHGEQELRVDAQHADANLVTHWIRHHGPFDLVLVDTYLLGAVWQTAVRSSVARLAAFDDLINRPIQVDLVVNAAAEVRDYATLAPGARVLCGLSHAVTSAMPSKPPEFDSPGDFLVAFGASDPNDATSEVLHELSALRRDADGFEAWIQLGGSAPHRSAVEALASKLGWARMLAPTAQIDARQRGICVAVGASGVSLYERMRDGIPSVVLPLAPNQRRIARAAERCEGAVLAGSARRAVRAAIKLREHPEALSVMSRNAMAAIDGLGARRIAASIVECCR